MKIEIVAKCVYQTRLMTTGNATRLQKLCVSSQERAIRTAVSHKHYQRTTSFSELLSSATSAAEQHKKVWSGVMERKHLQQIENQQKLKQRLGQSFAHERKIVKNTKETLRYQQKKSEMLQQKFARIGEKKLLMESTFAQQLRDVECRSADRNRRVQENRERLSASRSATKSPISQRSR